MSAYELVGLIFLSAITVVAIMCSAAIVFYMTRCMWQDYKDGQRE